MHVIAYRYSVGPAQIPRFERTYGAGGEWERFFARAEGYLGTELLRSDDGEYLLLDRWESASSVDAFLTEHRADYDARSRETAALYEHEERLGAFDLVTMVP